MAENLVNKGLDVTIVEATPQVLPPFDPELAILIADELVAHGACVETGTSIASVQDDTVTMADGEGPRRPPKPAERGSPGQAKRKPLP
jgi:NADH dehydrogenase FAD-containing subunit